MSDSAFGKLGQFVARYRRGFQAIIAVLIVERLILPRIAFEIVGDSQGPLLNLDAPNFLVWASLLILGGLLALVNQAVAWYFFEKQMQTNYGPGGKEQPQGWDSVFFGMTIAVGLFAAASEMRILAGIPALPRFHFLAWLVTLFILAFPGCIFIYGISDTSRWRGARLVVLDAKWPRSSLAKQAFISLFYFSAISTATLVPYRLLTGLSSVDLGLVLRLLLTIAVPFILGNLYMIFRDPEAATSVSGGHRRGRRAAILLMVTLYVAIYS